MFRHPAIRGASTAAVAYLAIRFSFFTGPDLGIGNTSTTWTTTLVAAALGGAVAGFFATAAGRRRVFKLGFTAAAGGGIAAVSLILVAHLLTSNLFDALLAGDLGAAGWTLLVTAIVWVSLVGIIIACGMVAAPVALLVARLRTRLE